MITISKRAEPETGAARANGQGHARAILDGSFWAWLAFTLVIAGAMYMALSASWPKFSRAEVFFAECAREMLEKGNFVTPLYHGQPFFDKPILTYWLILAGFKTMGVSHLCARIPSIVAATATVLVTGLATALIGGRRAGIIAAMTLSSSFMFLSFAALCMSDMLLVFFDTLTLVLLYAGTASERRRTAAWWLASATMGLAFLTKGPVGLVLPAAFFLLYLTLTRQLVQVTARQIALGLVTFAIVASPWFVAAWNANGSEAMYYFFIRENLQRFAGSTYDSHRPVWFMLASLFSGFAPWSVFLPLAAWGSAKRIRQGLDSPQARQELYLWLWIALVVGFFSLSRGKIDYYVLPAYPAAAALTGIYLHAWIARQERPAITTGWLMASLFTIAGMGSVFMMGALSGWESPVKWAIVPGTLCLSGLLMFLCMHRGYVFRAYALAFTGLCLSVTGFALQILPSITRLQPCINYASVVRASAPQTKIGMDRGMESWIDELTFQTGREPVKLSTLAETVSFLSQQGPALAILPRDRLDRLPADLLGRLRVLDSRPYISHALNPGYAIKTKGRLAGDIPLVLVTNRP